MKQTRQKTMIYEAVINRCDHPSAEDIYNELKPEHPSLSLATVYRNLNTFALKGMIRKIAVPNAQDRFDGCMEAHEHAICSHCGKIVNVANTVAKKPRSLRVSDFKVQEIHMLIYGVCKDCQGKNKERS